MIAVSVFLYHYLLNDGTWLLQVAPEILHAGPNEPYQSNVDVYSVGCVAYTLLCGYEPFYGQTDAALIAANKAVRSVRVSVQNTLACEAFSKC